MYTYIHVYTHLEGDIVRWIERGKINRKITKNLVVLYI